MDFTTDVYIRTVLGITKRQQWQRRITSSETQVSWGDLDTNEDKIRKRRLEWLGHIAHMPEVRLPKTSWLDPG